VLAATELFATECHVCNSYDLTATVKLRETSKCEAHLVP
jgi:hypothetical protein